MSRPVQAEITETFGLPDCDTHLIAKLRNMDPELLATIRGKKTP